jgi:hypothetical protein
MQNNDMLKKGLVWGIIFCMLLIVNTSTVISISDEKVITKGEEKCYIFEDSSGKREIKYIENDDKIGNDLANNMSTNTHDNLAPNPSFEEGDVMPTGWAYYSIVANGIFHWDSNYSYSGEKSVGSSNLTYKKNYHSQLIWETTDFIPVEFGENEYGFSVWVKYIGTVKSWNQTAGIMIAFYNESYGYLGGIGAGIEACSEWSYVSYNTESWGRDPYIKYVKLQPIYMNLPFRGATDPSLEVRFDDVYFGVNNPPDTPTITGKIIGHVNTSYNFTIQTTDPEQDKIKYYIYWGDNTYTFTGLNESGAKIVVSHIWNKTGKYNIEILAADMYDALSDWTNLSVVMPYSFDKPIPNFLGLLLQRFPNAFPILRQLFGY